ncbi:unnamed protein product, partial [Rotaria sp. Silwood1]
PEIITTDPKYRIDCYPDFDEYKSFCMIDRSPNQTVLTITNQLCTARGCTWVSNAATNTPSCYIPIEKGGYNLTESSSQISDVITIYKLSRLSIKATQIRSLKYPELVYKYSLTNQITNARINEFSMFGDDIHDLNVQVSLSGSDKIRMTIRDANAKRYEVPVPIIWQPLVPLTPSSLKIKFEITKTPYGQVGFRVQRTNTQSIL